MSDLSPPPRGTPGEVFRAFLKLGLTSFGGPIAHLSYFRDELVVRRKWVDEQAYADLVALCQLLPGPASSQVGFALGLQRGGVLGALAGWAAFTLPSAFLLILFALGATALGGPVGQGLIAGLKIAAVAIVAQAVWGMAKNLCPDRERATIALGAVVLVAWMAGSAGQIAAIAGGGALGWWLFRDAAHSHERIISPLTRRTGTWLLITFFTLLIVLPFCTALSSSTLLATLDSFYRAGALVFGGGHVVLPLLQAEVVHTGQVTSDAFLAGYGAAQAVPGPLFTFAAYLGYVSQPGGGLNALVALVAVFLPGLLLLAGTLPFWDVLRAQPRMQGLMRGANAAVVGILGAALYDPVFTSAVTDLPQFALALTGFILLVAWKMPSWAVVALLAVGGVLIGVPG